MNKQDIFDHFRDATKMVEICSGAERSIGHRGQNHFVQPDNMVEIGSSEKQNPARNNKKEFERDS